MKLVERAQEQSQQILKDKQKVRNKEVKLKLQNNSVANEKRFMLDDSPQYPVRNHLNNIKTNRTNSVTDQSFSTAPSGHLLNSNLTFMNSLVIGTQV